LEQRGSGSDVNFTRAGKNLRWRAVLTRQYTFSEAPYLDSITVDYTTGSSAGSTIMTGASGSGSNIGTGTSGQALPVPAQDRPPE